MIWFGWVLWHVNNCRLFNAKFLSYIYIKYIAFDLVGFYGISTIVGYLIPNPLYIYCCIVGSIKVFHRYKPKSRQVYQRAINAFPLK